MSYIERASLLAASHIKPASTSLTRPVTVTLLKVNPTTPFLFLSSRLPGVPNNPYSIIGMPNVDRGDAHVDNRLKNLEQLYV